MNGRATEQPLTLRRRLVRWLFPATHVSLTDVVEARTWARDGLMVEHTIRVSWADWFRLLFGGALRLHSATAVDVEMPGRVETETAVHVNPPRWMEGV